MSWIKGILLGAVAVAISLAILSRIPGVAGFLGLNQKPLLGA